MQCIKKSWFLCLALLGFSFISLGQEPGEGQRLETILLYVGIQYDHTLPKELKGKKLKFEGPYKRYTGLKHNSATGTLRFTPRKPGISALNIKSPSGQILKKLTLKVQKSDLQQTATEIQSLLRNVDGIQIKILNNRVIIDGEIVVPRDMKRIHEVVNEYRGKATSFVTLSPLAQNKVAKFIEKEIGNPNITVRAVNMTLILEGFVDDKGERKRAEEMALLYLPDKISDLAVKQGKVMQAQKIPILNYIKVREKKTDGRKKLIQLIVHYVELNKDYADSFRFQWTPGIADKTKFTFTSGLGGALGNTVGMLAGTINNFLPKLNWAKSFGFARILHSANVITEEDKPASIVANKQVPYQVTSNQGQQVVAVAESGITMNLTPKVVGPRGDSVQLSQVQFQVSNIVGTAGTRPITTNRTLSTSIHVQNGLSAVMGGIISNKTFTDYNKAPPNSGNTPPLFSFLASKNFNRSQSQFVVFVTPIIKTSASSGVKRIKRKFKIASQ